MSEIERFCIVATGDKHTSLKQNLQNIPITAEVYLRDAETATHVRGYIPLAQAIEKLCFRSPSENWVLAHFGLTGPGMIVTAEIANEPIGAQYVTADAWEGKFGLRFWTTVVHPDMRRLKIASMLTALSTFATRSWAQFGGTICDTDSKLMGRNVKLDPIIVTANMYHTPGRRKVQLEWRTPKDPFVLLLQNLEEREVTPDIPIIESLIEYNLRDLPKEFGVLPASQVWEDIAVRPELYRRYFRLEGWSDETKTALLTHR